MINKSMKDKDIESLEKTIEFQEKQIKALKQGLALLEKRIMDTDRRARRNSEILRQTGNDINNIKRKLGSV